MESIDQIQYYNTLHFFNWGDSVNNTPCTTFIPSKIDDIIRIVKWARTHDKRVRCSGYRHTWNNMFAEDGEVLIAMIPLSQSQMCSSGPVYDQFNDLLNITLIRYPTDQKTGLVKIGASVDNGTLKEWCIKNRVCLPMNVIMTENTVGGMVSTISHGSGIYNETMSDLVYAIDLVDYNGKLRHYNRSDHPKQMEVVCGAFGLCGIIVAITFRIHPESFALMKPKKLLLHIGIPRDSTESNEFKRFEDQINKSHYNEYFWFPFSDKIWVNCWKTKPFTKKKKDKSIKTYPSTCESLSQRTISVCSEFIINNVIDKLSPKRQSDIFSHLAMLSLPDTEFTTHIMNAIHFRHGIHNMRVRNYEIEIPITSIKEIPRLWWTAIDLINIYKKQDKYPVRIALEMRIMSGSSHTLMAPQRGNRWTCSIEILTTMNVPVKEWLEFINKLISLWDAIKKNCRPHWAKGWELTTMNGNTAITEIKEIYKHEINKFNQIKQDENLDNINMFSNVLFDDIFNLKHVKN